MDKKIDRDDASCSAEACDPLEVTRQDGASGLKGVRAVAFVWGPEVSPAPSLPFGRWKTPVPAAA